jgi:hypothetical protein
MEAVEVSEAALFGMEVEFDVADGAVTVFFNKNIGDVVAVGLLVVVGLAVNEHHNVGVLLDGTGVA